MKRVFIIIVVVLSCLVSAVESESTESDIIIYFSESHTINTSYHFGYNPFDDIVTQEISTEYSFPTITTWNSESQGWNTGYVQGFDFTNFTIPRNKIFLFSTQSNYIMKFKGELLEVDYSFEIEDNPKYFFVYYPLDKENSTSNQFLQDFAENILSISFWDSETVSWVVDNESSDDSSFEIKSGEVYRLLINRSFDWNDVLGENNE